MQGPARLILILLLLSLCAAAALLWALVAGEFVIAPLTALSALFGQATGIGADIVLNLRLPRAVAVFACGGLLALAGALMQVLLRNPLADPYILGVSGGAAVGALLAMMFGLSVWLVDGAAFAGALGTMLLVFGLAHGDGSWT